MKATEKAEAIETNVILKHTQPNNTPAQAYFAGLCELALACALLTSTSKEERERGKLMVRQLRHGSTFEE